MCICVQDNLIWIDETFSRLWPWASYILFSASINEINCAFVWGCQGTVREDSSAEWVSKQFIETHSRRDKRWWERRLTQSNRRQGMKHKDQLDLNLTLTWPTQQETQAGTTYDKIHNLEHRARKQMRQWVTQVAQHTQLQRTGKTWRKENTMNSNQSTLRTWRLNKGLNKGAW